jgi:hypothetical protein
LYSQIYQNENEQEDVWILRLDRPFDVGPSSLFKHDDVSILMHEPLRNVTEVQVTVSYDESLNLKKYVNAFVKVKLQGSLFRAHTAHHHRDVLLFLSHSLTQPELD